MGRTAGRGEEERRRGKAAVTVSGVKSLDVMNPGLFLPLPQRVSAPSLGLSFLVFK